MFALIQANIVLLLAAMLIGVLTGRWMFLRRPASAADRSAEGRAE